MSRPDVIWHRCPACGQNWPFPYPEAPTSPALPRDWRCPICLHADYAKELRSLKHGRTEALVLEWHKEADRLDAIGKQYYQGDGSQHPLEWALASNIRKQANELSAVLARSTDAGSL